MGLTPTKNAVIGTFINGRNDQNDFLQLATNNGDSVFAWIDAQGNLRGTFAVSASLLSGQVGFGSASNELTGDPSFTFSTTTGLVVNNNLSIGGIVVSGTIPLTVTQKGTGPLHVEGTALFLTDGVTPGVGAYFTTSGSSFRIRMDSALQSTHGDLFFQSTGVLLDGGGGAPTLNLYTGAAPGPPAGVPNQSATITLTGTGLFAVLADQGVGDKGEILLNPFTSTITFYGDISGNAAIGTSTTCGTPNKINIPTTTAASAGLFLTSDGGNPQTTNWSNSIPFVSVPANSSSTGTTGQMAADTTHLYVCTATNTWGRATLASF